MSIQRRFLARAKSSPSGGVRKQFAYVQPSGFPLAPERTTRRGVPAQLIKDSRMRPKP